jgi:beta-RFAP synthase
MATPTLEQMQGPCDAVDVFAPARLHLGFLDLNGDLGRRFGSLGLALDGIGTRLTVARAGAPRVGPASAERAAHILATLGQRYQALGPLDLALHETIPEHVGLGSGTQLGLAIAAGVTALAGQPVSARTLAPLVERGARSGIGIGAFETGGFLVDGGRGAGDAPAPIVARLEFPSAWRIVLISDDTHRGLSGADESAAFRDLPNFPSEASARLCRLTLLRLLPGLAEADFDAVAESLGEINARVGDHFAPAQGGRYASPRVAKALSWLAGGAFAGIGQSSWGPTGFALVAGAEEARALRDDLARRFGGDDALSFRVCAGRNRGAEIRRLPAASDGVRAAPLEAEPEPLRRASKAPR